MHRDWVPSQDFEHVVSPAEDTREEESAIVRVWYVDSERLLGEVALFRLSCDG
jgi:hypothetical protein